jgi:hypothetical protein
MVALSGASVQLILEIREIHIVNIVVTEHSHTRIVVISKSSIHVLNNLPLPYRLDQFTTIADTASNEYTKDAEQAHTGDENDCRFNYHGPH